MVPCWKELSLNHCRMSRFDRLLVPNTSRLWARCCHSLISRNYHSSIKLFLFIFLPLKFLFQFLKYANQRLHLVISIYVNLHTWRVNQTGKSTQYYTHEIYISDEVMGSCRMKHRNDSKTHDYKWNNKIYLM